MTNDEMRTRHYERLNAYRNSAEYAAYARTIGYPAEEGDLPSLLGDRWEIDEEIYMHFLEILPPLGYRGNTFYMREFTFEDVTSKFTKDGERYFCEFARYPARQGAAA